MSEPVRVDVAIASTGAANLASVLAALDRALAGTGRSVLVTEDPDRIEGAAHAILPGVGAFGPAAGRLASGGIARAFRNRFEQGRPSMGICLGMQLFCSSSEESGGCAGMGIVDATVRRFACTLPLPQLGWNRVRSPGEPGLVRKGWAYFANSYRVAEAPPGFIACTSEYGEAFVASLESVLRTTGGDLPRLLLCQFHPELSGAWGQSLYRRWLLADDGSGPAAGGIR